MHRDQASAAISTLLAEAETRSEIHAIARVGRRAKFLWECPACMDDKYPNCESCCGNPRPDDPWEG